MNAMVGKILFEVSFVQFVCVSKVKGGVLGLYRGCV